MQITAGEVGTDHFTYTVSDGAGGTATATVTVTLNGLSDTTDPHPIVGTEAPETLLGTDGADELLAGGGNDVVLPKGGPDLITLGAGADTLEGGLPDLNGDTVTDFSGEDTFLFRGTEFGREDVDVGREDPTVLRVDTDHDGVAEAVLTLLGDFASGDFMAVAAEGDTALTFETFLPALQERQAVDPLLVNGIINQAYLRGDGETNFKVSLRDMGYASYRNVLGVYEVGEGGTIEDAQILVSDTRTHKTAQATVSDVEDGHSLGFFLIQDGAFWLARLQDDDVLSFVTQAGHAATVNRGDDVWLSVNGVLANKTVFHSFSADLNMDGVQHTLSGVDVGGESVSVGFEDMTGGGDRDYEDVVFRVERISAEDLTIA